jgi:YD repeat-containing protein
VGGGRVVTDTVYDALGRAATTYAEHVEPGTPSGVLWWEPEWSVPAVTKSVFDNANRPTAEIFLASNGVDNLVEKWRTTTAYEGDLTKVTPPAGGIPTTTVTDIEGRTAELRQHTTAAGVGGAYDAIQYRYDPNGKITKVVDQVGNEWTYRYDNRGRIIETRDPDRGLTVNEYNDFNELVKVTDARGKVLVTNFDQLSRKSELREDSATGPLRAKWTYDRLARRTRTSGRSATSMTGTRSPV